MNSLYNRFESIISRWPWKVFAVYLALNFLLSAGLYKITIDTSVDRVLPDSHPLVQQLQDFKNTFISDNKIIIGFKTDNPFTQESLAHLENLASELAGLPEVEKVVGIPTLKVPYGQDGQLSFKRALDVEPELLISHPLFKSTLISKDGNATLLQLYPSGKWPSDFPSRLLSFTKKKSNSKTEIYIAGVPAIEEEIVKSIYHDLYLLSPVIAIILVVFLVFIWRDLVCTSLSIGAVLLTLSGTFGVMGWNSIPVTVLTPVLPPLIMAATFATAAHVLSALREFGSSDLHAVFKRVFSPCLFATLTTAVGFGSLIFNPIIGVKEFGLFALVGILFSFLTVIGFLVPVGCILKITKREERSFPFLKKNLRIFIAYTERHYLAVITCFTSVLLVFFVLLLGLKVDISIFDTLDHKGVVYKGYQFFQNDFSGVSTLELDLKNENGSIADPRVLTSLMNLQDELEKDQRVNTSISIADFIYFLHGVVSPHTPISDQTEKGLGNYIFLYRLAGYGHLVDDFITRDMSRTRLTVMVKNISAKEFSTLSEKVTMMSRSILPEEVQFNVTGTVEMYSRLNQYLFYGLVKSLATAFTLIGVLLIVFFRSSALGLISLLPNAFPLFIIYGTMRIFNLSIDVQSAMIGCISLGISVDATVHFLHNYKAGSKAVGELEQIRQVWVSTGVPVLIATLTLIVTFGILISSSFYPIRIFGILSALGLIAAIWADLFYLPALLFATRKIRKQKVVSHTLNK